MKNAKKAAAKFFTQLQALTESFNSRVSTNNGDWIVKGFIDVFKNVYTISGDTKVISKVIELTLFPQLAELQIWSMAMGRLQN